MRKKATALSFIIGLFFLLVALILLVGYFTSPLLATGLNMYSGIAFLVFGLFMVLLPHKNTE